MSKVRITAVILLLVGIGVGYFVYASQRSEARFPFRLGLDLSGGTLLTYRADVSDVPSGEVDDAMNTLRDVIERRVNLFGVAEPVVQTEEASILSGEREHRLIVELPGVTDVEEAVRQLGETPLLEFKLLAESVSMSEISATTSIDELFVATGLTGRFLKRATLQFGDGSGGGLVSQPTVVLEFNDEGTKLFADITREHVGDILAIFLDGTPITEPVIQTEIPDGTAVITGDFTPKEARDLVRNLNFGALPVPVELIGTQSIGASLGGEILRAGVTAGLWGLILVAIFMVIWYRLPGLVSVLTLGMYVVVVLALFKLIPVTLTAAGIAGFILSIGMAVDANVLIFERMRDERRRGHNLETAVREGFARAWLSIRDGNLSTLITAAILFWFGTSLIQGFALTLGIGVLVSMVTAITATRLFLLALVPKEPGGVAGALFEAGFGRSAQKAEAGEQNV
ncbi:protein translocase subunit SecD [Candidatus Wolfebacteria bacterium]|nr:protein translocase subunit SecD [Candidatus Wolfebacteria bacterium]